MVKINNIIKNIIVDAIIITTILQLLNNNTHKYFVGFGLSIYLLTKYL